MEDIMRYRPFMVALVVWFTLLSGCGGDPRVASSGGATAPQRGGVDGSNVVWLASSPDAGATQDIGWGRVDYYIVPGSPLRPTGLETPAELRVSVGGQSATFVPQLIYEDDYGITVDLVSAGERFRMRLVVPGASRDASVYLLDEDQLTESTDAVPLAHVYRNEEGLFVSAEALPEAMYTTAKQSLAALEIILGSSLGAAAGTVAGVLAVLGLIGYMLYIGVWAPYDCTTWFRRWINGCD